MNLQATDPHPWISAVAMDDRRVNKMTLETAQMYCTSTGLGDYKPTHSTHPLITWCANNISWLIRFHHALAGEYYHRFGKQHKSFVDVGQYMIEPPERDPVAFRNHARSPHMSREPGTLLQPGELTVPIDFSDMNDVHKAYRYYLRARWWMDSKPATWTNREPPDWLDEPPQRPLPFMLRSTEIVQVGENTWRSIIWDGLNPAQRERMK